MEKADKENEQELIRRVVSGERNEFRHLLIMYQNYVYSLIMRQVGEADMAKDLTQETFIKAYNSLAQFRNDSAFSTWLTRIALNTCHSYFRSRKFRDLQNFVELKPDSYPADSSEKHDNLEKDILRLQQLVGSLAPKYREVVVLCCFERKSYKETAQILAIAEGTVGSRLNKAFSILRKKMQRSR